MNGEFSIKDLDFPDGEDDINDPDYEPQPSEFGASDSDISMLSAGQATTISTDISIPSAIPTDAQSIADVSDIFPDDSVSQRDLKLAAQTKRYQVPPSEASETPSIVREFWLPAKGIVVAAPPDELRMQFPGYQTLFGRAFNQSDHYMLPADDDEHSRLDMQHLALRLHLNSLYPSKHLVDHALREGQEPPPAVLDVGTGSGRWAIDMALQFPHVEVVGLDLVPPATVTETSVPPNCRFEVDDANLSFEHYDNCFNVVHMRSSEPGINDFQGFLYEIARTLRPGGVLLLVTGYPRSTPEIDVMTFVPLNLLQQVYDIDAKPFPVVEVGEPGFVQILLPFGRAP
ncbi:hypothetical protein FRC04_007724 [Tulasnella sp. 424]|nr:hypothetical protein FRC04_007724 [Tulasnella sp. 424]